jgi:outer membrane cobalamin receptor
MQKRSTHSPHSPFVPSAPYSPQSAPHSAIASLSLFSRKLLLTSIAAASSSLAWQGASAQQLEEIVVTAERRELLLQDTPLSVMAFTGDKLEASGVEDMFDLADIAPNLEIKGARGSGTTAPIFQIRGGRASTV